MRRTFVVLALGAALVALLAGTALAATLKGTAGPDKISGTLASDYITGAQGNDIIDGRTGNDKINGNSGNDRVNGGPGDDSVNGAGGKDVVIGGDGADRIRGGGGDDYISSVNDDSRDYVYCGTGTDTVEKSPGVGPQDVFADDCEKTKVVAIDLSVEKISSGIFGPERQQVVVAPSAATLSKAINQKVPDSGKGTYLAAYWGNKPTCGYSIAIKSAERKRDTVTSSLALRNPPSGAGVCTAFTQPYAISVIKDLNPKGLAFSFENQRGQKLDWPIQRVSN